MQIIVEPEDGGDSEREQQGHPVPDEVRGPEHSARGGRWWGVEIKEGAGVCCGTTHGSA